MLYLYKLKMGNIFLYIYILLISERKGERNINDERV